MSDSKPDGLLELDKRVAQIYREFMTRITKYEELVSVSNRLINGFHQQLELLRRPPLNKTSEDVDSIIKAHQTERMKAYVQVGCRTHHSGLQNINQKVAECQEGLRDHLSKAKDLLNELESLMEDVLGAVQTANESTSECWDEIFDGDVLHLTAKLKMEEMESTHLLKPEISDYVAMMGILYHLMKQDYTVQEKIVSSLSLNSSSGELEGYCLIMSKRPCINNEIMNQAWRLI